MPHKMLKSATYFVKSLVFTKLGYLAIVFDQWLEGEITRRALVTYLRRSLFIRAGNWGDSCSVKRFWVISSELGNWMRNFKQGFLSMKLIQRSNLRASNSLPTLLTEWVIHDYHFWAIKPTLWVKDNPGKTKPLFLSQKYFHFIFAVLFE